MREMLFNICAEIINHTTADIILTSFFGFSATFVGYFCTAVAPGYHEPSHNEFFAIRNGPRSHSSEFTSEYCTRTLAQFAIVNAHNKISERCFEVGILGVHYSLGNCMSGFQSTLKIETETKILGIFIGASWLDG